MIQGAWLDRGPPSVGRCDTSGRHTTSSPSTMLRMNVESACIWLRDRAKTSTPTTAVMASTANADALRLAIAQASSRSRTLCSPHGLSDVSSVSGSSETCAAAVNRPANMSSAVSFARKTTSLLTGSGPRMRKSRSSGNSEWLTSSVTNATRSIGSPMISMSSPSSARRYRSCVPVPSSTAYLTMNVRVSRRPNAMNPPSEPMSTRLNESAARSLRKPKSNIARKKCSVRRHSSRAVNRRRHSTNHVVSGFPPPPEASARLAEGGSRTVGSFITVA